MADMSEVTGGCWTLLVSLVHSEQWLSWVWSLVLPHGKCISSSSPSSLSQVLSPWEAPCPVLLLTGIGESLLHLRAS